MQFTRVTILSALMLAAAFASSAARERRHHHVKTPTPTAAPTPALKPVVLITGGTGFVDLPAGKGLGVLSSAEIYDPAEHRFMPIVAMKESRDHLAAAAIGDDKVLVAGGVNTLAVPLIVFPGPAMPWILRSAELFDPSRKQFVASGDMKDARDEATATTLGDGKVLIAGGTTNTAELYDPDKNAFIETGAMAASRYGHTATLLGDGNVLIAGGGFQKIEVYNPLSGKFYFAGELGGKSRFSYRHQVARWKGADRGWKPIRAQRAARHHRDFRRGAKERARRS